MIHKQWHIKNSIRETPAPLASSFNTPSFSSAHPSPNVPSYSVPFLVYWLRQTALHVEHAIHGWLDALLCLERNPIECWLIQERQPHVYIKQEPILLFSD